MFGALSVFCAALTTLVDPFIGTAATGHAFPGPCRPFGMVQPSPDTGNGNWKYCSGYVHSDRKICRFSQTHLNGTGQAGLGDVALLPFMGEKVPDALGKSCETARVGYYAVTLEGGVRVEVAAGVRTARYRVIYPEGKKGKVLLDFPYGLYRHESYLPKLSKRCEVARAGSSRFEGFNHSEIWSSRDIAYVVEFGRAPESVAELPGGKGPRYVATFAAGNAVEITVALSAKSIAGARANFAAEAKFTFDELVKGAEREWEAALGRFNFSKIPERDRVSAATAMYHFCIQPNLISDVGEKPRYSTFSLWDTYRDAHPLYERLFPEMVPDFVNSLLAHYDEWGYLPKWELWGREGSGMIGEPAVMVVADAVLHGFKGIDARKAFAAVKRTLTDSQRHGAGMISAPYRLGGVRQVWLLSVRSDKEGVGLPYARGVLCRLQGGSIGAICGYGEGRGVL